ncbi:biliverdin-producing heme oxygenase [Paraoerskovia sediminicola]|uniref:Biliverdin-producing heme oxygenase n=1 Tax=Paraoerskovia sediminicola TaxID=1138587 RepID=A0ABM8G0V1_9CELL|nr:biliverdin-producing heme oxygenase [Paraoerskovia sediminicola]BDZ41641.1 biliverdin-producing heme oxygenase [Paraoerskovia sediminicola]
MKTSTATSATERAPLSLMLREGTRADHERAESSGFVEMLMKGALDVAAYADLAAQQYAIYGALESASTRIRQDRRGATLVFDELERVPSIERDLRFLVGDDWAERITIRPATKTYVARLLEVGDSLPRYAAHAYTRYLGDLSGGQIVRRMLERHYGLGDDGLEFYAFREIPKSKPFKDVYRERLDALDLDPDELEVAVSEAQRAFRLNSGVFADLGAVHCENRTG